MGNRGLFTFLILLLGLGILFGGLNVGYDNATKGYAVVNETMTVNYSSPVPVNRQPSDANYSATVEVHNSTGALLTNGTDYNWMQSSGEVEWLNTNATSDGATALISYDYNSHPESTKAFGGTLHIVTIVLVFIAFLLAAQWLFDVVGDW